MVLSYNPLTVKVWVWPHSMWSCRLFPVKTWVHSQMENEPQIRFQINRGTNRASKFNITCLRTFNSEIWARNISDKGTLDLTHSSILVRTIGKSILDCSCLVKLRLQDCCGHPLIIPADLQLYGSKLWSKVCIRRHVAWILKPICRDSNHS